MPSTPSLEMDERNEGESGWDRLEAGSAPTAQACTALTNPEHPEQLN